MRRRFARRNKKQGKIIIITSICLLLVMTAGYSAFSTHINITAKGNILKQDRVIQSWGRYSNEDFHTDYYRENIVSATFLDNNNVPDNATESWNVSEDKNHGGVMAWVIQNSEDNTKYDLYIGANKGVIANDDSSYLFSNFRTVENINFNDNFDTNQATNMQNMFWNCTSLTTLDLSSFDTRNVTNMYAMFSMWNANPDEIAHNNLISIIFGDNFITSNVTNMRSMFAGLEKLQSLDLSTFDTSNVTNMFHMFLECQSLTELNLCSFNTSKVTDMKRMFGNTFKLTGVYVGPNWITSQVDTTGIFGNSGVSSVTTGQC